MLSQVPQVLKSMSGVNHCSKAPHLAPHKQPHLHLSFLCRMTGVPLNACGCPYSWGQLSPFPQWRTGRSCGQTSCGESIMKNKGTSLRTSWRSKTTVRAHQPVTVITWENHVICLYFSFCCCVASVMSNSVRPHKRQPTRLLRPWDSPGKNTGVGCHFLLQCMKVERESEVAQSCLTLSDPMDCSLPGSSIHGIFQARVLEWGAIAFSLLFL